MNRVLLKLEKILERTSEEINDHEEFVFYFGRRSTLISIVVNFGNSG